MPGTLVSMTLLGVGLLLVRPGLATISLRGMASFLALYVIVLKVSFVLAPAFLEQWNREAMLGYVGGMPLNEILWAAAFGAAWPAMMAYAFDRR